MEENKEKKSYELSFLVVNKGDENVVESVISRHGAEVTDHGMVSEVRLSYPIKKNKIAHFGFLYFLSSPEEVEKISHDLKLNPVILRILVITPPIAKSGGRRMRRVENEEKKVVVEKMERAPLPSVAPKGVLTNEDLEEKLEEILK
ncbi:MAG: 30S ribosomal protein S6 [Patescibacteria group bacterium]